MEMFSVVSQEYVIQSQPALKSLPQICFSEVGSTWKLSIFRLFRARNPGLILVCVCVCVCVCLRMTEMIKYQTVIVREKKKKIQRIPNWFKATMYNCKGLL